MTVITKDVMRDQAATRVEDVLRNIPGIICPAPRDNEDSVVDIVAARLKHRFNEQMDVTNTVRYRNTDRKAGHAVLRAVGRYPTFQARRS